MVSYLGLFFVYAFVGWILDTSYRSLLERKYFSGSFFPFLTPIYGIAGILLTLFFQYIHLSFFLHILFGTVIVVLLELFGGIFCVHIFGRRYWDYSDEQGNLWGHISFLHSAYWLLLVSLFRMIFPSLPF